ncbi:MAG: L-2-hydroxyglutarate oxidase [Acidimicrobiia bacterium]
MTQTRDVVVIGGGIVGLSTALAIVRRWPGTAVTLLEKEQHVAGHQTGHNSGVIHSGIYYKPGSLKATLCTAGNRAMVEFCREHDIAFDVCGKIIVATEASEIAALDRLYERAIANSIAVEQLGPDGLRDHEPNVRGLAGLYVPSTGIVDYVAVARTYAALLTAAGGEVRLGTRATSVTERADGFVIGTDLGEVHARFLVNCAGLHSDRVARLAGTDPGAQIVPFRGEYFELVPERRSLVKNLIYPVPDPEFPFLGVHYTRMIDGTVHCGPNAVPGLAREGYRKRDIELRDVAEIVRYRGFWKLAAKHRRAGLTEIHRSLSKKQFLRSLQRLIPAVQSEDIVPTHAGVRAQALARDGALIDDFLLVPAQRALHVCNAPSPAATASLEIGRAITDSLDPGNWR